MMKHEYLRLAQEAKSKGNLVLGLHYLIKTLSHTQGIERLDLLYEIAMDFHAIDQYEEAIKYFSRIIEIYPKEAGAYYGVAMNWEALKDWKQAKIYYQKALAINPNYDRAAFFLANLYDELGDKASAIAYYEQVLEIVQDYMTYNNLGSIYEEMEQYDQAKEMLEKSIDLRSDYYLSYFNLGVVEKAIGNRKKAEEAYYISLKFNPFYVNTYLNLSALYIEHKEDMSSKKILERGIKFNPTAHNLYYNLACSLIHLGEIERAFFEMEQALTLSPNLLKFFIEDEDFQPFHKDVRYLRLIGR